MTVYEQNNQKGIAVVFTAILLVIPFLISGLQLNHVKICAKMSILNEKRRKDQKLKTRSTATTVTSLLLFLLLLLLLSVVVAVSVAVVVAVSIAAGTTTGHIQHR